MRAAEMATLLLSMLLGLSSPLAAQASHFGQLEGSPNLRSASALVVDAGGKVIYGKDIDTVRPIASITKLMTIMVILDSGLDLDEEISVSKTGYINESGRCLVMQANIEGERISIVLLNSFGKLTPFGDSNRLRKWMLAKG